MHNKSIYYPNYVKAGILFCHHFQFDKDNIQSYNNGRGFGVKNTVNTRIQEQMD